MRIKELLIDFYQELKDDNNQIYDINGIRSKISSKAEKLLNIMSVKTTIENDSITVEIEKEKFSLKLSEFKKITNMIKNDIKINIKKYIELIQYDNNKDK